MVPLITFVYVSLSCLITSSNLLVIVAVTTTPALRKATNFALVSLAMADLFVGVIVLPLRIVEVWAFHLSRSLYWCQCSLSLTLLSLSASVLNLSVVTAERYLSVILPLLYQSKVTSRRVVCALIFVWAVALSVSFLPFITLKSTTAQERSYQHKICRFADTMSPGYLTFFVCIAVLIPTLFMSYAYVRMYRAASKLKHRLKRLQVPRVGEEIVTALKESKAAKTIGTVVGVFYICWIPFMVAVVLSAFLKALVTPVVVLIISTLVFTNSAMNPVLYGYLNRDFRLAYKRLVSKVSCPRRNVRGLHERGHNVSQLSFRDLTYSQHVQVLKISYSEENTKL